MTARPLLTQTRFPGLPCGGREHRQFCVAWSAKIFAQAGLVPAAGQGIEHFLVIRMESPVGALGRGRFQGTARNGAAFRHRVPQPQGLPVMTRSRTSHTAAMAGARVLDLRHTAPTVREGAGLANRRIVKPRCDPNGDSTASSGSFLINDTATT